MIPTNGDAACVFVGLSPADFYGGASANLDEGFERALATAAPELWRRVRQSRRLEPYRGFGGHGGFIRKSTGPGWALVGDASYFKDPGTAHGISDALRDAEMLARAIVRNPSDLGSYQLERDRHEQVRQRCEARGAVPKWHARAHAEDVQVSAADGDGHRELRSPVGPRRRPAPTIQRRL